MSIRVLHVSNISPYATKEQIQTLFGYVGRIEEFKLYPSDFMVAQASQQAKFAYVKFESESGVDVGQHLTNTVFLDRALVCIPATSNTIPEEEAAIQGGSLALPGQRQLPPHISNQVQDIGDGQKMIVTIDPTFAALGLPAYPPLPPTTEPAKVEEIRRTVYVGNLPKGCDGEQLLNFFNACIGEVMYLRMAAGNEYLPCDYAYVEFSQQASVPLALQNSDSLEFQGRILRIQHSKVAIIKPQRKTAEQSLEEVEEAIKAGAIGGTMDLGRGYSPGALPGGVLPSASSSSNLRTSPASSSTKKRSPSRSRSRSIRRRRSRSRSRSRSSSYSRRRRRRSRTRSRSRDSRRKRSSSRRRSRSKKRSSVDRSSKKKKRSRSRDRSPVGKSSKREKEKERSSKKDKEGNGKKDRKRSRSRSVKKEKEREEKSSKKSKRSVEDSPKKTVKKEAAGTDSESTSTRTDIEAPSPMDISPQKKTPKQEPPTDNSNMEEEENLRERLLEKVKIKHQQQKGESNDEE